MKKKLPEKLLFSMLLILAFACGSGGDDAPQILSSQKVINSFIISGVNGTINNESNLITGTLEEGISLTSLTPTISISPGATISPASGVSQDFTNPVTYTVTAEDGSTVDYTVIYTGTILPFTFNGVSYEIVKDPMNWRDAAAFAVSRGGFLAEINNINENNAIASELINNAGIDIETIQFPFVWLGGNDFETEGTWILDGDNDGNGPEFWIGEMDGMPVNDLFNNWGTNAPSNPITNEEGTDGLGMVLRENAFFLAGQWEDLIIEAQLFFVIEFN
ncbi:DUF5018 domain-containing protein [Flavobacteriaceae bacterium R38]|nr:DUF5018 domain-containing protein [Flavobacteriaceae bacterium R38]